MRSVRAAVNGLLAAMISIAGCIEPVQPPPPPEPVTIGVVAETNWEGLIEVGAITAANRINSAGGLLGGRPVRVESRFFTDTFDLIPVMNELIDEQRVGGLIGPYNTQTSTFEAQLTTFETQVVHILPSFVAADPIYRAQPENDRYLYIFGPPASGAAWPAFGDALVTEGCTSVGAIAGASATTILESTVAPRLMAAGVTYTRILRQTAFDDPTFIRLTQAAGYDCILLILDSLNAAAFVRAWYAEPAAPAVRFAGLEHLTLPGFFDGISDPDVMDGSMVLSFIHPDPARAEYDEFAAEVRAVTGEVDGATIGVAAGVYDAVVLISLAIERAGATRGPAVREALVENSRPDGDVVGPLGVSRGLRLVREAMQIDYNGVVDDLDITGAGYPDARRYGFLRYEAPQGWMYVRPLD